MSAGPSAIPVPALPAAPATIWDFAGFWWRVLAALLDLALLGLLQAAILALTGLDHPGVSWGEQVEFPPDGPVSRIGFTVSVLRVPHWHAHGGGALLVWVALTLLYCVGLESSRWQATVGKRVCAMRVTDLHGRRIGPGRALGRFLGKSLSWALWCVGFLMVGWTRRKQGLHDLMAGTLVLRRREAVPAFTIPDDHR